jgi:hypothetical protein
MSDHVGAVGIAHDDIVAARQRQPRTHRAQGMGSWHMTSSTKSTEIREYPNRRCSVRTLARAVQSPSQIVEGRPQIPAIKHLDEPDLAINDVENHHSRWHIRHDVLMSRRPTTLRPWSRVEACAEPVFTPANIVDLQGVDLGGQVIASDLAKALL